MENSNNNLEYYTLKATIPYVDFKKGDLFLFDKSAITFSYIDKNGIKQSLPNVISDILLQIKDSHLEKAENNKYVGKYCLYSNKDYKNIICLIESYNMITKKFTLKPLLDNTNVKIDNVFNQKFILVNIYYFINSSGIVQRDYYFLNDNMLNDRRNMIFQYRVKMNNSFSEKEEAKKALFKLLPFTYKE